MLDFLGIGAQKAGTTWLYEMLSTHPHVRFPQGKEIHFWNNRADRALSQYTATFDGKNDVKRGEITPAYALLDLKTIKEIFGLYPKARLFYSMRNPIDRAWSAALMLLSRMGMRANETPDSWFLQEFQSVDSLARGDYEACIRSWRAIYPASSLAIFQFEDIAMRPRDLMVELAKHIGLTTDHFKTLPMGMLTRKVFEGPPIVMPPHHRAWLEDYYRPKIQSLEAYLDIDLSHWTTK
jgi:hypothetical protein